MAALGDEDIRGLDVAMDDALDVSGVERVGNVDGNIEQAIEFERLAADEMLERLAIEKFHGDKGFAVLLADVVNGADVGMIKGGGGLGFALETCEGLRVFGDIVGKKFERDETVQANVFGFVNDAHAAAAEFFGDAVVGDGLPEE